MPGIPLVARETSSCFRITDQMCREDSRAHLSAEEEIAAEESLSAYCKPVELYNILQRRAVRNPSFLQRCLHYKIQAKHKKRMQMTISLSGTLNQDVQSQSLFPLYILLARLVSDDAVSECPAVYRFNRACILTGFIDVDASTQATANFILPDINKLALEAKSGTLAILFISFAGTQDFHCGIDSTKRHSGNAGGYCLWGKMPLESLHMSWEQSPNMNLGQRAETTTPVDLQPCFMKLSCFNEDKCVSIQVPSNTGTMNTKKLVQVTISAEVVGAREESLYDVYTCSNILPSSLSHIARLRAGNVIFNYRYYNNKLQSTEVTEDFTCPFCLVKCASFKGLRYHMPSSHDLFDFEFWVTEEYQAVNIAVKTDIWRPEIVADGIDPKQQTFFFCSKKSRRRRQNNLGQNPKHAHPLVLESNLVLDKADDAHSSKGEKARISGRSYMHNASFGGPKCLPGDPSGFNGAGATSSVPQSYGDADCAQSASGNNLGPSSMLQFAKTRKLSAERYDPRNRTLLQKRQFFHSHRAQPMTLEQVTSDRDSEDEVDDDVADLEDRRVLDDFVDVTKDEKQIMHMWNSFVRKQRVLADGHIPWACEAFSRLHGPDLIRTPSLIWCWRFLMIKLWNHGILDARTMNKCNITLEQLQKQSVDPKQS